MKKVLLGLVAILSMVFLVACGDKKTSEDAKVVRYNLEQNPAQLDPQLNTETVSGNVLGHIMEGLTSLGADGNPIPGVAESWTTEGNVWTFKLRKDAKWHNGDSVVAGDFLAAWERALNPATASEYSYIMYSIKGAQEYNEGKTKDFATVGVKATDDYTIVVDLKEPVAYFASLVSFYTYMPQNQKFFEEHKETYATSAEDVMGNGPFKLISWEFENKIIVEKADTYWNKDSIKIDTIEMAMVADRSSALKAYQNGELDWIKLSPDEVAKFKADPEMKPYEDGSVWYLMLNNKEKLFSNKKVRKAIALSIDRQALVEKVEAGSGVAAYSFVPSVIPGKKGFFREDYDAKAYGITYNPEEAKKLFAEGLAELGMTAADVKTISLVANGTDVAQKEAQFYQEQLKVSLGLDVKIEPVTQQIRVQRMTAKDYQIVLAGWGPDYNDPMTYMDLWLSNSGQNNSNWASKEYDSLIAAAKVEADPAKRMDLMAQAEKLLMDELPIVPTFFRQENALIRSNIKGVVDRALSPSTDFRFANMEK